MKKNLLFGVLSIFALSSIKSQNIAAARAAALGTTVTVKGIVLHGSELGSIRYIQDNSAGIAAYYGTVTPGFSVATIGDSVSVTGVLKEYKNLLEIDPINSFSVIAGAKPLPTATVVTPADFSDNLEAELVKINNCSFSATGTFTGGTSGTNYTVTSNTQTFVIRILPGTNLVGTPIPTTAVNITAIVSQFCNTPTVGCTNGYQLLPRNLNDIVSAPTAGLYEIAANLKLHTFPNPANDRINFEVSLGEKVNSVTITDALGRIVLNTKENSTSIDVINLNNGIYYMNVNTNKTNYTGKINISK